MDKTTAQMILGLDKDASFEDAKKTYRNLAKQYHPDLMGNGMTHEKDAGSKMKEINLAFRYLAPFLLPNKTKPEPKKNQKGRPGKKQNRHVSLLSKAYLWIIQFMLVKKNRSADQKKSVKKQRSPAQPTQKTDCFEDVFKAVCPDGFSGKHTPISPKKRTASQKKNPVNGYQIYLSLKQRIRMGRSVSHTDMRIERIEKIKPVSPVRPVGNKHS